MPSTKNRWDKAQTKLLIENFNVSVTPSLEAGLTNNFYNDVKGLRTITSGIDLTLEKGPFSVKGFYRHQDGKTESCDFDYGGISFGYAF